MTQDLKEEIEETMLEVRKLYYRTKGSNEDSRKAWKEFPKYCYVMFHKIQFLELKIRELTERESKLVEALRDIERDGGRGYAEERALEVLTELGIEQ